MRVTTKGARTFFLSMLIVGAVLLIYQCFTMAQAFNLSPYTFKLRAKGVATDSVSIYGGSLHAEHVDSVIVLTLRAGDKVVTDTIQGAGSVVGIVDDTLRLDTDSTGAYAIITFGGWGGGIRWNESLDAMEFTNDFTTWTSFGSGSGTGDIEGVTAGDGLSGGGTSGTPTLNVRPGWGIEIDNDSVKVNATEIGTLVGESDSNAITYSTDRIEPYSDTGIYIGGTSDHMMMDFTRADTILAFVGVFYGEGVADSMLMSKGWIEGIVGDSISGKIDGINSSNGITGSASSGVANIQLDPYYFIARNDSIVIKNSTSGQIILNVDGTPPNLNEMTITENNIELRTVGSNGVMYLSGYDVRRLAFGAAGTLLMSTGASSAPVFYALTTVIDTLTGTAIPLADSANGGAIRAETAKSATTADSALASARTRLLLAPEGSANTAGRLTADSIVVDTLFATRGNFTNLKVGSDVFITDITGTGLAISGSSLTASLGTEITSDEITDGTIALGDMGSNSVDSTKITDGGIGSGDIGTGRITTTHVLDNTLTTDDIATGGVATDEILNQTITKSDIDTTASNFVFDDAYSGTSAVAESLLVTRKGVRVMISDTLGTANFFKTAGDGLTSSASTVNVVAGANGLTVNADSVYVDTTKIMRVEELRANWLLAWDDSTLGLGGLTLGTSITLGADITDDTLVVDYYPEYTDAVLADLIMPVWKDSIKIYGYIDTVAGMGNTMLFNDSVLTSGLHRRGVQLTIKHPMRVDSLRYIIVQGLVKDSSATNTMFLKGMLRTSPFRAANVDSNAASTIKDYDSLGGDFADVASVRQFVLSGGAITEGSPWYLLLIARHGSGTAWNWAQSGRIRAVYSRTRL